MNRYFNYDKKFIYDRGIWADKYSVIKPLTDWITTKNYENFRLNKNPDAVIRPGGVFVDKSYSVEYPDIIADWEKKGIRYASYSMTNGWIAMVPVSHFGKINDEIPVLLVLADADLKNNEYWSYELMQRYNNYNEMAAKEGIMIIYIASNGPDLVSQYVNIVQEAAALYHVKYKNFYLDISTVYRLGFKLKDIPGFTYKDEKGNIIEDPDAAVIKFGSLEIPALSISNGRWANKNSLTVDLVTTSKGSNAAFDGNLLINKMMGKRIAEAAYLEYRYDDVDDPDLIKMWENMGVQYEKHSYKGEQWITMAPMCARENPDIKLPVMAIFKEVNDIDPHQAVTAFSYCYNYIELSAQGDCIVLFFALETDEDNDMLHDILQELAKIYPVDLNRVYLSGHSHNGRFSLNYATRHPEDIAAVATLGNQPDFVPPEHLWGYFKVTDEKMDILSNSDIPFINISGYCESGTMFPIYRDATDLLPSKKWSPTMEAKNRIIGWQRRLKAFNCPMRTEEEIKATEFSEDYVERMIGIPADKTECLYLDGFENYIADIKNNDGKFHLRIVALGGMPHLITPTMVAMIWSFVRRFAKDPKTKKTIELF